MTGTIGREIISGAASRIETTSAGGSAITAEEASSMVSTILIGRGAHHDLAGINAALDQLSLLPTAQRGNLTDGDISALRHAAHTESVAAHAALPYADSAAATSRVYPAAGDAGPAYSLTNRSEIGMLIAHSPQLDNIAGGSDFDRCGGAAMFNAMLLDADPSASARAIRETASEMSVAIPSAVAGALTAMERAPPTLTAPQAATMQNFIYDMARHDVRPGTAPGLTAFDVDRVMRSLTNHGAMAHSTVHLTNSSMDRSSSHWTVAVDNSHGHAEADSYPRSDGYATCSASHLIIPGGTEAAFVHLEHNRTGAPALSRGVPH